MGIPLGGGQWGSQGPRVQPWESKGGGVVGKGNKGGRGWEGKVKVPGNGHHCQARGLGRDNGHHCLVGRGRGFGVNGWELNGNGGNGKSFVPGSSPSSIPGRGLGAMGIREGELLGEGGE